ncbi:MAG: FAD-dependent oxidoreductase [Planctomycetes bacterium]|nr:FAD-dependent oxidoreductase [Planctomycetota bacterium]
MAHDVFDRKHEILVAGGGLCGWAAALTAARAGRNVLLVSRRAQLGWEIALTQALQLADDPSPPLGGLAAELLRNLADQNAARDGLLCPPAAELMMHQMAEEAGVELLLYAAPLCPVQDDDGRITGILVGCKSGQHALRADLVVDATDTLLLARDAGLPLRRADSVPARLTVMLNGLDEPLAEAVDLGPCGPATSVVVRPSLWSGEAAIQFTMPTDSIVDAHLAVPQVLHAVRDREAAVRGALVTTMSVEPLPLSPRVAADPQAEPASRQGLLLAGPVRTSDDADQAGACSPAALIALGESVGAAAAKAHVPQDDAPLDEAGSLLPPPPHERADVIVLGGGTAGAVAAIAAARHGADTLLVEPLTYLGGIGTGGGIHMYYHGRTGGLQDEIDRRAGELSPLFMGRHELKAWDNHCFHPDAKKVALLELATEAGVRLALGATATGVIAERYEPTDWRSKALVRRGTTDSETPARVTAVVSAGPEGVRFCEAAAFVDSTGDGDVAAMAGAEFVYGREGDGLLHAFSQSAGAVEPAKDDQGQPLDRLKMVIVNFDAGYVDPDDVTDLTRGRGLGLRHLRQSAWADDARWTYIAPHLGLRQGRQIVGDYQLTLGDQVAGRQFPDVIGYAFSHYDNHAIDYENESDGGAMWVWLLGQWRKLMGCEIPYRCLLPRRVEGLLVACRALSLTQDAHHQLRMQRDMQRIGEVAGIAAALAARQGLTPRTIDVAELQGILRKCGALRESDRPLPALPEGTAEQLVERLGEDKPFDAAWQLARDHQETLPALRDALRSDVPAQRFWSAATLAMAGDASGAGELIAAVRERRDDTLNARKAAPQWMSSIVLLGRVGSREAVPALCEVLQDGEATLSAVIAAVRALGRIGDASAEKAVRGVLTRKNLDTRRFLQFSMGNRAQVAEEARWQLDLAVAEALSRMGRPDRSLAEPYLDDERAYVRRRARTVLAM